MSSERQLWEGEAKADTGDVQNSSEYFIGLQHNFSYACLCFATAL